MDNKELIEKIKTYCEGLREISKKKLDKMGYFDEWEKVTDLAKTLLEGYNLGMDEAVYEVCTNLLKMIDNAD